MSRGRTSQGGFTLLEVMVAMAILAVSLTAIFASEAGAIRAGQRARTMSVATLLARCKMAEVEEYVAQNGLPAVETVESDKCCEGAETDGYTCDWKIERIVLPEPSLSGSGADAEDLAGKAGQGKTGLGGTDPIMGMAAAGGVADGAISDLVLSYAFPAIKPSIEEQVRRATVVVHWKEGTSDRSFDVVQFLVDERGAAQPSADSAESTDDGSGTGGVTGTNSGTDANGNTISGNAITRGGPGARGGRGGQP